MRNIVVLLLLTPLLPACLGSSPADSSPTQPSEGFSESMRWSDFFGAATYMTPSVRAVFLEQFQEDDDLHVVDSSTSSIDVGQDQKVVDANYVMEYYYLPSSRIKKWRWKQHWRVIQDKEGESEVWLIDNEPPPLPWKE